MKFTPAITFQRYTDAFYMPCMWPSGMKIGDGSADHCGAPAARRVIFSDQGRTMLCRPHAAALRLKRLRTARERA